MKPNDGDLFSDAQAYEAYVGRWSRFVAQQFIAWIGAAPGQSWLDVGAGTGILTQIILQDAAPARVVGIDVSQDYINFARSRLSDPRVEFRVDDAVQASAEPSVYDVAVAGLVLNFLPDPQSVVNSMARAVKDDGIIAAYVWDYGGQMEMMRHFWDAASVVDPAAREMDAGQRFAALCSPDGLRSLFQTAGLRAIHTRAIDIQTPFRDFDDYWLPFLGAQGSVAKYLRGLGEETRDALRDQLRRQLPVRMDGGITLGARAWAVQGQKPDGV